MDTGGPRIVSLFEHTYIGCRDRRGVNKAYRALDTDQARTYDIRCGVEAHVEAGMVGKIILG